MSDRPSGGDMTQAFSSALESASATPAEASPASPPETPTSTETSAPTATTPADATTETPVSAAPEQPNETKGEPPKWRWQDILANARETTAKETEARIRQETEQRYQWAKDIADHERAGLMVWRAAMNGDPAALASIKANPQAMQWLQGFHQQPPATAPDPEPEPDFELPVRDAQGNVVGTRPIYSAEQQAKREAWLQRKLTAEFEKRLEPLQQTAQTFQQREQQAAYTTTVTSVLAKMKAADPTFEGRMKDVGAVLREDARLLALALGDGRTAPNPELALELADARVYRAKVVPAQQSQTEAQVVADLKTRAVAGTVNPSAAASSTPKKFKPGVDGFSEALAHFGSG